MSARVYCNRVIIFNGETCRRAARAPASGMATTGRGKISRVISARVSAGEIRRQAYPALCQEMPCRDFIQLLVATGTALRHCKTQTMETQLDQLKKFTTVVADTGDFESLKQYTIATSPAISPCGVLSGDLIGAMEPSRRTFPARNMATTEAALMTRGVSHVYLSLGDPNP